MRLMLKAIKAPKWPQFRLAGKARTYVEPLSPDDFFDSFFT
jgi:hypothetical protein